MATKINLGSPREINRFAKETLQKQQQERREFEEKIEQHHRLIRKYRAEVYNEKPDVPRLFQLQRIITQFVDLLTSGKYFKGAHNTEIVGSSMPLSNFLEWKGRLSDQVISEYSSLLNSVNVRATQKAQYPKLVNGKKLSEEETNLIYCPETFAEMFINPADIEPCVDALRLYRRDKPILGDGKNWTGSRKDRGLLVAWIERMETMRQPKIQKITDRKKLVVLLNGYFENLNMGRDASVFTKVVDSDIRLAFASLIPQ